MPKSNTVTRSTSLLPVYDPGIIYESYDHDNLITVDENGLITVTGDVPAEGKAIKVKAFAGSSSYAVSAQTMVILGNYDGARIVGKLTIYARPVTLQQFITHSAVVFTAYEDTDLDISFYNHYKPNDKYISLMEDYEADPDKYSSDPALYNDDEIGIGDTAVRETYFDVIHHGPESDPSVVSLKCGDSISISNYRYDSSNMTTMLNTLQNSTIS